jgi:PAS domain S-box-containing protein
MVALARDISERKQAEAEKENLTAERNQALERLKRVLDGMPIGCVINDPDFKIIYWNQAAEKIFGWTPAEVLNKLPYDTFIFPASRPHVEADFTRMRSGQETVTGLRPNRTRDGRKITCEWINTLLRDAQGNFAGYLSMVQDVTEKIQAQEALQKSQETLHALFAASPLALIISDKNNRVLQWNPAAERIYGWKAEDVIEQVLPFVPESEWDASLALGERVYRGEVITALEVTRQRKDGSPVCISLSLAPLRDGQGKFAASMSIAEDISGRKQAEIALRRSEQLYRALAHNYPDGCVFLFDRDLRYLIADGQILESIGLSKEQMEGKTMFEALDAGTAAFYEPHCRAALAGQEIHLESPLFAGRIFDVHFLPLRSDDGEIYAGLVVTQDITARKQVEEQTHSLNLELEKRVARRTVELEAKNKELEAFAYSVSHDLKAPLRAIDGYSSLLEQEFGDVVVGDGKEYLQNIRQSAQRMNQLIEGLLEYSRLERRTVTTAAVDPQPVVAQVLRERAQEMSSLGVQIVLNLPYMRLKAEAEGLTQALRNLVDNSLKFTRQSPNPYIEIGGQVTTESAMLWVKDNGIGFDMRYHNQIFEIFQHLHRDEDYPGTGIGLAIVHKAMERMGGRVWANSEPGKGATFFLEFPK